MKLVKKKPGLVVRVVNEEGRPSSTAYEEKVVFRQHFAKLFQGEATTFSELIDDARNNSKPCARDIVLEHADAAFCSSLQLSAECRLYKQRKASGEDLHVPELYGKHPMQIASLLFPLRVKVVTRLSPPIQWRGGMVAELFKGK